MQHILHIIVAAGSGSRFGAALPKQFCLLGGRPVLMETIDRTRSFGRGKIVVVISDSMRDFWLDLCREHSFTSPDIVAGGATRYDSVKNAIAAYGADADIITVHDGARPLAGPEIMRRVVEAIESGAQGVVPAIPVTDSLRLLSPDGASEAVDRASFRAVQTPQAFSGTLLREAYSLPYRPEFTDDASVAEAAGASIAIVDGSPENIKITHPADIILADTYMKWNG